MTRPTDALAAARQVAAESPPLDDFPARGLRPERRLKKVVREAGWPTATVTAEITHPESVSGIGIDRAARTQVIDILIVPERWLRRYAELVGRPLRVVCDGRYDAGG